MFLSHCLLRSIRRQRRCRFLFHGEEMRAWYTHGTRNHLTRASSSSSLASSGFVRGYQSISSSASNNNNTKPCPLLRPQQDTAATSFSTATAARGNSSSNDNENFSSSFFGLTNPLEISDGPPTQFGLGKIATLTHSSIVGTSGSTVVLTTVALQQTAENSPGRSSSSSSPFLTVEYHQRSHGVGHIPTSTRFHRDNLSAASPLEVLGSRAIDRALRPLMKVTNQASTTKTASPLQIHVHSSLQSYDVNQPSSSTSLSSLSSPRHFDATSNAGHPIALAINTASAALGPEFLSEPVAAIVLTLVPSGSETQHQHKKNDDRSFDDVATNVTNSSSSSKNSKNHHHHYPRMTVVLDPTLEQMKQYGWLLYAGTRKHCVMMEYAAGERSFPVWGKKTTGPDNDDIGLWSHVLNLAQASLQPILDSLEQVHELQRTVQTERYGGIDNGNEDDEMSVARHSLGLPPLIVTTEQQVEDETDNEHLVEQAIAYCSKRLGESTKRLFGWHEGVSRSKTNGLSPNDAYSHSVSVHTGPPLLNKTQRGKREQVMQCEILRLVDEFLELQKSLPTGADPVRETFHEIPSRVTHHLLRKALWETSSNYGVRADQRGSAPGTGVSTIRPIQVGVPALPDKVHGSALFSRGDTQVLCTVTLGPPQDGIPLTDPFQPKAVAPNTAKQADKSSSLYANLPVGSLRFLRTQEAMISDLNSRNVQAEKEQTGDSGSLADVQRAFLQYDFPPYSTGTVLAWSMAHNRRAIGHGALAERAILPILPSANEFPYAIRMTSEVTDSNGSSSMASVCGVTMALLDAGVPLKEPVSGVSVGLVTDPGRGTGESSGSHCLLLDITGTEDHYGVMDFKIAGTRDAVTAFQLDVKEPLPVNVLVGAFQLAQSGRRAILDEIEKQLTTSSTLGGLQARPEPKPSAPRVEIVRFAPQRKRDLIGPGGIVLRQMEDRYGVSLDLTQEGQCLLFGSDREMVSRAKATVMDLVADVLEGEVYLGTVIDVKDFGVIMELLRNKEGILHISEITGGEEAHKNPQGLLGFVRSSFQVGQEVEVLCIGVDDLQGAVKLSQKALVQQRRRKK